MSFSRQYKGGPLKNVFLRAYFDVLRHNSQFNFGLSKQSLFRMFFSFCWQYRSGTPDKCDNEGLFLNVFDTVCVFILLPLI